MAEPKINVNESLVSVGDFETSLREVEALSDEELYDKLVSTGKDIGPVVGTTRRLYQKQLATIISSPAGAGNTTNGNADEQNGDMSDSDDASFETSSRASRSSRGSSLPKKTKVPASVVTSTPLKLDERPAAGRSEELDSPQKREAFSAYSTPNRSTRTFDDYVAESEARKAIHGDSYLRRQQSHDRSSASRSRDVKPQSGLLQNLKLFLLLAVLAALAAYIYLQFGESLLGLGGPKDRDSIIDKEIEELTKGQ